MKFLISVIVITGFVLGILWAVRTQTTVIELKASDKQLSHVMVQGQHILALKINNAADYRCQLPEGMTVNNIFFDDKVCDLEIHTADQRQFSILLHEKVIQTEVKVVVVSPDEAPRQLGVRCERTWGKYFDFSEQKKEPTLLARRAVKYWREIFESRPIKTVLDLGCGTGQDTLYFLSLGAHVKAIDYRQRAIDTLVAKAKHKIEHLDTQVASFETLKITKPYDIVYAHLSLPFIAKENFDATLRYILKQVPQDGLFVANFFGDAHEWHIPENNLSTFLSKEELLAYFKDFIMLDFKEIKQKTSTVSDGLSQWHQFDIVARKR